MKYHFQITEARNGQAALRLLTERDIDIVITDIKMPVMDGMTFLKQAKEKKPDVVYLIYSGYDDFLYAKEAIALRVLDFLVKPVKEQEFFTVMENAVQQASKRERKTAYEILTDPTLDTQAAFNGRMERRFIRSFRNDRLISADLSGCIEGQRRILIFKNKCRSAAARIYDARGRLRPEAFTYALNQERYLRVFLDDPTVPLDNNAAEIAIRPFTIGRKNWGLIDTPKGAEASAIIYSIVETAKANNLKTYPYLTWLLGKIAQRVNEGITAIPDELLPWSPKIPADLKK